MRFALPLLLLARFAVAAEPAKYEVEVATNVAYRSDKDAHKTRHKLDIYVPKGKKNFPVFYFIHGGAWVIGDKMTFRDPAKQFASQGIGVVCPNYRLTPDVQHPKHVEDVATAFAWTLDHIAEYGGDPNKVVIGGHSAGGHLAALLATNENYLKAEKKSLADVKGVVGVSGVYVIDHRAEVFHKAFTDDETRCKAASPLSHVAADRPPMMLAYADADFVGLPAGAEVFGKALVKAKCEATTTEFKDRNHITIMTDMRKADDPLFLATKGFILKVTK